MRQLISVTILIAALSAAPPAHAYIGPGASAGAIALVFGVIASVFFAFVAIVWYPIKRLVRRLRSSPDESKAAAGNPDESKQQTPESA